MQRLLDFRLGAGQRRGGGSQEQIGDRVGTADEQPRHSGVAQRRPVGGRSHGGLDHRPQANHPVAAKRPEPVAGRLRLSLLRQQIGLGAGLGPSRREVQVGGVAPVVTDGLCELWFAGRSGLAALGGLHRPQRFRQTPQTGQDPGGVDPVAGIGPGGDIEHLPGLGEAADHHQSRRHLPHALVVERARPVQDGADADHGLGVAARPGHLRLRLQRPVGLLALGPRRRGPLADDGVRPGDLESPDRRARQRRGPEIRKVELHGHGQVRLRMNSSSRVFPTAN